MSHCGPAGPAGNSTRFTETFSSDDAIACNFLGGELKLLLINYGTRGDIIAIDDLLTASMKCERLEFKAINARYVTPALMREYLMDRWCVTIDPGNSNYVGSACLYDGNGKHYGWRGGPGCVGFDGYPSPTCIYYQQHDVASDKVIVSNKEGASVEHLGNLMENCAFFDKPDEIHVVLPDDHKLVTLTYALRDKVCEHFKGPVKLVSYADTLLTNQRDELKIIYVAVSGARRGHGFDYEQYRDRFMKGDGNGRYVWLTDVDEINARKQELARQQAFMALKGDQGCSGLNRGERLLAMNGISGGFRRGEVVVLGAPSKPRSRIVGVMDEPAHAGGIQVMTIPSNNDWSVRRIAPQKKGPKGPITMPGIGERKKKGKHRSKY